MTAVVFFFHLRDHIVILLLLTGESEGFQVETKSLQKLFINAVITATVYKMACFKRKKERDVAPTRGQFPCPAFGPHGASLSAWVCLDFFLDLFFLLFVFSLSLFSGFLNPNALSLQHCQSGHLRTCAQPDICRQQVPEKVWDDLSLWYMNLIWSRCVNRAHLLSCQSFKTITDKAGHAAKNARRCWSLRFCLVAFWGNFVTEMRPVLFWLVFGLTYFDTTAIYFEIKQRKARKVVSLKEARLLSWNQVNPPDAIETCQRERLFRLSAKWNVIRWILFAVQSAPRIYGVPRTLILTLFNALSP